MLKTSQFNLKQVVLITLMLIGLIATITHIFKPVEIVKGILLAKYDLYKGKPKIYIYGFVQEKPIRDKYEANGVEPVFRGCIVGDLEYMDNAYNKEVTKRLGLN